jgi:transposase
MKAGHTINRVVVAFEAGYDGFWLARWLRARGIEAHVIHPTSVPVSREQRRAKTDRLDTGLLLRAVLGWLRGEPKHCNMVAIPTLAEEDARRPHRERETLVKEQTRVVNRMKATLVRFGIRNFKVKLRRAASHLEKLRGPEGELLPPNTLAELLRHIARLQPEEVPKRKFPKGRGVPIAHFPESLAISNHPFVVVPRHFPKPNTVLCSLILILAPYRPFAALAVPALPH